MRKEFTDWSVAREGFTSGLEAMIQLSRQRINPLSMRGGNCHANVPMRNFAKLSSSTTAVKAGHHDLPSSLKYRQSSAKTTPTERSEPVWHTTNILGGSPCDLEFTYGGILDSSVRNALLPGLPLPQSR